MNDNKQTTTYLLRINSRLWREFRAICARKGIPASERLRQLIEKDIIEKDIKDQQS